MPDYSLSIGPSTLTLQAGGAAQQINITQTPLGSGTSYSVSVTFPNLPAGIQIGPSSGATLSAPGQQAQFEVYADASVAAGTLTVNVASSNGTFSHVTPLTLNITAAASFQLSVTPASLTMAVGQQGQVQVNVVGNSGNVPAVTLAVTSEPTRADLDSPTISGSGAGPFRVTFSSTSPAATNVPVLITATSASGDSSMTVLTVTVTQSFPAITAPTRSGYVRTDAGPTAAVYDGTRKLVFVTLPTLNEVRVLSSTDGHFVASISMAAPSAIDESADGTKVFAGGLAQVYTIDPDQLEVIGTTAVPQNFQAPQNSSAQAVQLAALSTGEVMILNMVNGDIYKWNPGTGTMALFDPPNPAGLIAIVGNSQHTTVCLTSMYGTAASAIVYNAATASYGAQVTIGYAAGPSGVNVAINPNGTQIAAFTESGIQGGGAPVLSVYDGNLNLLYSNTPQYSLPGRPIYSLDGTKLYLFFPASAGLALDTQTFTPLGVFNMGNPEGTTTDVPLAIDETQMVFGCQQGQPSPGLGIALTDASNPGAILPGNPFEPEFGSVLLPWSSISGGALTGLAGLGFDSSMSFSVYLGPPPASPQSLNAPGVQVVSANQLNFTFPASTTPGPANVTLVRSDGWYQVLPDGVTYGPTILAVSPTAIAPSGQTQISIYGYGLDGLSTGGPTLVGSVSVGGNAGTIVNNLAYGQNNSLLFPTQSLQVTTPPGSPGAVNLTVSNPTGSTTLNGGVQYLSNSELYPLTGTLNSVLYDGARQRLYVSNGSNNNLAILDLSSNAFLSPISVGNGPASLALTPDGTELAVANSQDGTVSVIDPVQLKVTATFPAYTAQDASNCGGPTPAISAMTAASGHSVVAVNKCGSPHVLNLDTGSLSCTGITVCDSTGVNLSVIQPVSALASTPDGTKVFFSSGSAQNALLDLGQNTYTAQVGAGSQGSSAAIDADANLAAATLAIYNTQLGLVSLANEVPYLQIVDEGISAGGEVFNPSGSLLYMRTGVSIADVDIWDTHRGRLALRVALPDYAVSSPYNEIAIDETGSKMFAITRNGISFAQLANVPLSLASASPAAGSVGSTVTVRGSGFQAGTALLMGGVSAATTMVDSMTLSVTVPNVASGPVRLTVQNPDGHTYNLDQAFSVQ